MPPELRHWRSDGSFMINDFVTVLKGDRVGQEGVITRCLEGGRVEVCLMADHPDLSFRPEAADDVVNSSERLDDLQSSAERIEVSPLDLRVGDRLQLYDVVRFQKGSEGLTGIVRSKRPFGYVHIADTPIPDDKASQSIFLCQSQAHRP